MDALGRWYWVAGHPARPDGRPVMAWEISHSPEAWDNAARNLATWDREQLIEALTDDAFEEQEEAGSDNPQLAADTLRELLENADGFGNALVAHDTLVDMALRTIERHNTCSNGGHDFWIDRQGFHTVPVDFTAEPGDWQS